MPSLLSYKFIFTATYALAIFNVASARSLETLFSRSKPGINCDGHTYCVGHSGGLNEILYQVNNEVVFPLGTHIKAGSTVAATEWKNDLGRGLCAIIDVDYTIAPSTNGQKTNLGDVVEDLIYHGCDPCGSAPTDRVGNLLSKGSLTVNYCRHPASNYK